MSAAGPSRTLDALLRHARRRLEAAGIDNAGLDGRLLVEHVCGTTRADAIADPGRLVPGDTVAAVEAVLSRRAAGEPVHRILGFREFYGLRLELSAETLEPRPDTEILVDAALPFVRRAVARHGLCRILDLGTGAGAIALALLSQEPAARAVGVDISDDALGTASRNAAALGLSDRFSILRSDWFDKISGRYHAIVSNPPYIRSTDILRLQTEVRVFDPLRALDGGGDGLDPYRTIAAAASLHLESGGIVGVEFGAMQREEVTEIFVSKGFGIVEARKDLAGNDRAIIFAGP